MLFMKYFLLLFVLIFNTYSFAQSNTKTTFNIFGSVVEQSSGTIMEYCTVSLFNKKDNTLVSGTVSNFDGVFNLAVKQKGEYYLKVSFIGFETKIIKNVILNANNKQFDAGKILLQTDAKQVNAVEVTANRSTTRYEMDKKIISIDKNISAESGSAVDALEVAPSVQVEADGTVKLRGNSNFLVLVDGQPTALSGSEALQQIPAINIKNIEIITNPSAKYNAENAAGIINIILKQEKKKGTSGIMSINAGTFNSYGANVSIKHNVKKVTFDFSARLRNNAMPRSMTDSLYTKGDNEMYTLTDGKKIWTFGGYNFNYGMSYAFAQGHKLQADMVYGKWYMLADDDRTLFRKNITKNETEEFRTINDTYRGAPYFGPSLGYNGVFKNKHNLSAYIGYSQSDFSEEVINDNFYLTDIQFSGSKTFEKALNRKITSKIDYTIPIKEGKLEIGGQANNVFSNTRSKAFELNISDDEYSETDYNNSKVDFERNVYGIYAMYASKFKKFSYSLGLRSEYTDRKLKTNTNNFNYFKWNFFPTVHFGYNFDDSHQIYASYSSRINRPQAWQIEPQIIKTSVNTFFQGDQDIIPNIINSAELGWAKTFKKGTRLSTELFYNLYQGYREFITVPYFEGTTLTKPENVGEVHNLGLEINLGQDIFKWWNIEFNGSGFLSVFNVSAQAASTNRRTFEWNARLNNFFTITKTTKLQFTARYNSWQSTALGFQGDRLNFGLGLKQSFLKRALTLNLNARNIFNTAKDNGLSQRENYYNSFYNKPSWPKITLAVTYKINNYKQSRRQNESNQGQL